MLIFKPEAGVGQCAGNLSAKTNPGNNILELHLKKGIALLSLPNGGTRTYEGEPFRHRKNKQTKSCYHLVEEVLPSGHKIHYTYTQTT